MTEDIHDLVIAGSGQAITSAGVKSTAALDAEEFLEALRDSDESTATATASPEQSAP